MANKSFLLRTKSGLNLLALILALAALIPYLLLREVEPRKIFSDIVVPLYNLLTVAVLLYAAQKARPRSPRLAIGWFLLACGQACYAIADITWAVLEVGLKSQPFPSIADVFYLLYYPFFLAGVLWLPSSPRTPKERLKFGLEICIIMLSAVIFLWNYLLWPLIQATGNQDRLVLFFSLAYPLFDLLLLLALLVLIYQRDRAMRLSPLLLLSLSMALTIGVDIYFSYQALLDDTLSGNLILDMGYLISYLLLALAGGYQILDEGSVDAESQSFAGKTITRFHSYLPIGILSAAYLLLLASYYHQLPMSFSAIYILVGVMMILACAIQLIDSYENISLNRQLQAANAQLEVNIQDRTRQLEHTRQEVLALRQSVDNFKEVFDHSANLIQIVDREGRFIFVNQAWQRALGYSEEEILGVPIWDILHPDYLAGCQRAFKQQVNGDEAEFCEAAFIAKDGHPVYVEGKVECKIENGLPEYLRAVFYDVTERKKAEEELIRRAYYDPLTTLPNRSLLMTQLATAIERARESSSYHYAVLFMDVDNFKHVNDSLGHLAGDHLLIRIASRLKSCVRARDMVARIGGDEFVILLDGIASEDDAIQVAQRILDEFKRPFEIHRQKLSVTLSIGIAYNEYRRSPDGNLHDADIAMYHAKAGGKNRYLCYEPGVMAENSQLNQ